MRLCREGCNGINIKIDDHGAIWIKLAVRIKKNSEYVLDLVKEKVNILREESLVKEVIDGRMKGKIGRGKSGIIILDKA